MIFIAYIFLILIIGLPIIFYKPLDLSWWQLVLLILIFGDALLSLKRIKERLKK